VGSFKALGALGANVSPALVIGKNDDNVGQWCREKIIPQRTAAEDENEEQAGVDFEAHERAP
jgi:hypothetical protein